MPNQRENLCNRENFDLAVALLNLEFPDWKFSIKITWLDYGANMMWENILCEKPDSGLGACQFLYPSEWDSLKEATSVEEVLSVVQKLAEREKENPYETC